MENSDNPLADLLERQKTKPKHKMLTDDLCGYFATMKLGISPVIVAEATGLALPSVCHLRRAGEFHHGQFRYPKVAQEYATLGHDEFIHRYLTAPIREAIAAAITRVNARERSSLNSKGYNPAANRMVGRHEWPVTTSGKHVIFRIECHHDRGGYFWRDLKPFFEQPEILEPAFHPACQLHGDPERGPEQGPDALGFAISIAPWKHVKSIYNPKEGF